MTVAWLVLVAIGLGGALTFVLLYAIGTPSWHRTTIGRVLMLGAAVLAGLLALTLLSLIIHWPDWVLLGGMASLDAVLWAQVWQLWRIQHRSPASE